LCDPVNSLPFTAVCILPFGVWDVRRAFESGEREIWLKYVDKLFGTFVRYIKDASKAREKAEKTGFNVVTQFVIVFDFKGFSMRQLTSLGSESIKPILKMIFFNSSF